MSIKNSQQLKQLKSRESKLEVDLEAAYAGLKDAETKYDKASNQLGAVRREIRSLTESAKEPVITEHAMIRYLERRNLVDFDLLKAAILPEDTKQKIKSLGNGKFPIGGGLRIVVKDGSIVSVVS